MSKDLFSLFNEVEYNTFINLVDEFISNLTIYCDYCDGKITIVSPRGFADTNRRTYKYKCNCGQDRHITIKLEELGEILDKYSDSIDITSKSINEFYSVDKYFDYIDNLMEEEMNLQDSILRKAIYDAYAGYDFWTGQKISLDEMQIDHIFPKNKGGRNNILNLVPTRKHINNAKRDITLSEEDLYRVLTIVRNVYAPRVAKFYRKYLLRKDADKEVSVSQDVIINFFSYVLNKPVTICKHCRSISKMVHCNTCNVNLIDIDLNKLVEFSREIITNLRKVNTHFVVINDDSKVDFINLRDIKLLYLEDNKL